MSKDELAKLLKENLKVNIYHPHGDFENVIIEIYFGDELIADSDTF